ncbi:hypothetical protein J2T55_001678 [Methylohalomonas lacus]|uniref:Peptidase M14 domain-containing protein n=2 Tax=Methylohalomonas lacus TaxID=398773 RepID=A0AAE3HJS6_9GAMM|nr:hypothetical protein [Methylohalomonas lacus]
MSMTRTFLLLALFVALPITVLATDTDSASESTTLTRGDGDAAPLAIMSAAKLCTRIGNKLGSVSVRECQRQNMAASGGVSVNGLPILIKTYPPLEQRRPLGRVLLVGGIHGDEYSSVSVVFKWMNILNKHHSGLFHWRIAPLVNPDGLLRDESQRMNANGVDLNRNFPMQQDWQVALEDYWIEKTGRNPRRYPGSGPLSEPETRWLAAEIERFQPDAIVSVHAPYGIVDYDGPRDGPQHLGRLYLELLGTYPGSLGRYAGIHLDKPLVTIELPYAGIMPSDGEINDIWIDLVRWLRDNLPAANVQMVTD